ncbi:hypothetical protein PR048_019312 [Dryococelus australis]|uniref:Nose resistant-to-fluoxetine protein N-terminal domain-containing protein n=1 Tax=Dryococelus australis TaxID=614101 RepID=A0ABQ9H359_9NEOP|nr:hypothetical protein PR048_019312 [Dryococelus australis]
MGGNQSNRSATVAQHMMDSSAKLTSGLLRGNANQLGDFDECLEVDDDGEVRGQYCLASLDVSAGPGAGEDLVRAVRMVRGGDFLLSSHRDVSTVLPPSLPTFMKPFYFQANKAGTSSAGHFVPRYSTLQWALCVPASCRPGDVELGVVRSLARLNESSSLRVDARVEPDTCYSEQRAPSWTPAATAVMFVFGAVVALVLIATLRDNGCDRFSADKGRLERAALSFSLRRTVPELLSAADGDVRCVHGLRALGTAALYLAHRVIVVGHTPYLNRDHFVQVAAQPWTMVFRASIVYTDTFLFLSGLLAAYSLSKELARTGNVDWRRRLLARYIRLTPAMVSLLLFNAFVWEHLGNGPMWNKLVTRNADLCKQFLWRNMLYLQNFFPFQEMCGPHTHQLALDMQLFLVSPLLVRLLQVRRWLGLMVFAVLNVCSVALRYWATRRHQLSLIIHHGQT